MQNNINFKNNKDLKRPQILITLKSKPLMDFYFRQTRLRQSSRASFPF